MGVYRGLEDVELATGACGDGQAEQREQETCQSGSHDGVGAAKACVVVEREMLLACTAELRNDGEGAELYQGVTEQVEKNRGIRWCRTRLGIFGKKCDRSERNQDVAGVRDGTVSQQALDVGLHQRAEVACKHGEDGQDPESPEPEVGGGGNGGENAQEAGEGGILRSGGEQRGNRRGGAFVDVRGPYLKGRGGDLEA